MERLPFRDGRFDAVMANGAVDLSPDKLRVFAEARRVLRRGGRLVISELDDYRAEIAASGFDIRFVRDNARGTSLLAVKP